MLKNGTGANIPTGASISGATTLTFQTHANLGAGDWLFVSYDPAGGSLQDLAGNPGRGLLPGLGLGGQCDTTMDLSLVGSAGYLIGDFAGGNDQITGSAGNDNIIAGDGNDVIHAGIVDPVFKTAV